MADKFAFPGSPDMSNGMTLRDYFAGQALTGIVMNTTLSKSVIDGADGDGAALASFCYKLADLMLAVRNAE